jgi:hypothetical protein
VQQLGARLGFERQRSLYHVFYGFFGQVFDRNHMLLVQWIIHQMALSQKKRKERKQKTAGDCTKKKTTLAVVFF